MITTNNRIECKKPSGLMLPPNEIIENGNSFKLEARTTTNADGTLTSQIPGPITADEKTQKKNNVKARSMLLMSLPNEHLLTFNQYKDAKTFAPSTKSLDSIFNRLQMIVSQLAILGENISQEDLNLKFLRSLPSVWNTHVVVWRNKHDLDTMSFDDNFKIVEQEVKGTTNSRSSSSSQNMAFVSSPSSTNEVNTAYEVTTANTQISPASTQVSTASTQVSTANLSDDTVYAFLASQPNGSQLVHEDLEQIHEDGLEEMDLKCDTTGYDKSKVECFNCHKMGHFARECRGTRNQDSRNMNQDSSRRTVNVEETSFKAMLAIDGAGFDWSYMADDEIPTNMALMAFSDSEESLDAPMVEKLVSDDKLEKKNVFPTVAKIEFVRPKQQEKLVRKPVKYAEMYRLTAITIKGKGFMKTGLRSLNTVRPVNTAHPKTIVMTAPTILVFAEENLRDPIDIRVDIIHPEPVAAVAFPVATVVRTLARHGEVIGGIHKQLLKMHTQRWEEIEEELLTLRERANRAETKGITLRARVRSLELIEAWLHGIVRDEREARERMEHQLGGMLHGI
ncbi:ribonuclease H-like domain-containing protein [Tanacetum coccineum]